MVYNNPLQKHTLTYTHTHIYAGLWWGFFVCVVGEAEVCHVEPICLSLSHSLTLSPLLHFVPKFSIQKMKGGERRAGREGEDKARRGKKRRAVMDSISNPLPISPKRRRLAHKHTNTHEREAEEEIKRRRRSSDVESGNTPLFVSLCVCVYVRVSVKRGRTIK